MNPASPRSGLQACGDGVRCEFVPESGAAGYTDCVLAAGSSFDGSACASNGDCPVGFNCERQRCAPACDPSAAGCSGGNSCNDVTSLAGQSVGSCCSIPAGQTCNLVGDCGCGARQTCSAPDATGRTECRALAATQVAAYASCSLESECPSGYSCIGSACKQHCHTLADCGQEGVACLSVTVDNAPVPGVSFCSRGCDLLSPAAPVSGFHSCGTSANCAWDGTLSDCIGGGTGVQGSSCAGSGDCSPGFLCYRGGCERWCDPSSSVCQAGFFCSGLVNASGRRLGSCCKPPPGQVCDWVTDCGCSESETCSRDANGARFCRAVVQNAVAPYSACGSNGDCPSGYECFAGACSQRCSADSDCSVAGVQCVSVVDPPETPLTGVCSRNCDVLAATAPAPGFQPCGAGLACTDLTGDDAGTSICLPPGPGGIGSTCSVYTDCGAAMDCDQGVCLALCELGSACTSGVCRARAINVPPVNGRMIGVCPLAGGQ